MIAELASAVFAAVLLGLGEWADDFGELDEGSRSTVNQQQWQRIRVLRLDMHEMDVHAINAPDELR